MAHKPFLILAVCAHTNLMFLATAPLQVNPMGSGIWFYDPWTAQAVDLYPDCAPRAGLAAVATRDIEEGEELFMDYKYHPNNRPAWYVPVDYPEEQ